MKKIIFTLIAIAILVGCNSKPDSEKIDLPPADTAIIKEDAIREINISAKRWEFTPDAITVKQGEKVKLVIDNTDTTHGIVIPEFDVKGNDEVTFTADKKGTFEFRCTNYCGDGHGDMTGTLIVE